MYFYQLIVIKRFKKVYTIVFSDNYSENEKKILIFGRFGRSDVPKIEKLGSLIDKLFIDSIDP